MPKKRFLDLADRAKERSSIYTLLARVYSREPSKEFLESFRASTFLQLLKRLGIEIEEDFVKSPLEELMENLSVEYTRLFIGPGAHIYPYESFYHKKGLDTKVQMKRLLESYGLQHRSDFSGNLDHISVELEFMGKVTDKERKAWKENDSQSLTILLKLQKQFIKGHLLEWLPEFLDRVIKEASLGFYREMARLTREYILLEAHEIENLLGGE